MHTNPKVSTDVLKHLSTYFETPDIELALDPSFECTNTPDDNHMLVEPYADEKNVIVFKELQQLESVVLIEPVGEEHMYYAAMNNRSCRLTPLGKHYWHLAYDERF